MSESKPFSGNGDSNGAVSDLVCAHCGSAIAPDATVDIVVVGTTLTACSLRGRAALLYASDGVDDLTLVDAADAQRLIDAFDKRGLVCARNAEDS